MTSNRWALCVRGDETERELHTLRDQIAALGADEIFLLNTAFVREDRQALVDNRITSVICTDLDVVAAPIPKIEDFLELIAWFGEHDIQFISLKEQLDSRSPAARFIHELIVAYRVSRNKIRGDAVRAGLLRSQQAGRHIGRPGIIDRDTAFQMKGQGHSARAIARALNVSHPAILRLLKRREQGAY